jgi:hypothetical protein
MKSIHSLIPDIYKLVGGPGGWFTEDLSRELGHEIALRMRESLGRENDRPTLRLSQMGPRCPKALWHSIHTPELAEPLPPPAKIKFTYGHTLEAMVITLAKAAGHEVTGEQDELDVLGVKGHRDCIIDGAVVDVKSSAGHYFQKFKDGSIQNSDTFGYLDQLDGYLVGSIEDDLVRIKDRAYLLAIDKHLGNMVLYEHHLRKDHILKRVAEYKDIVARDTPPECCCEEVKDGESGNFVLGVNPSYSAYKYVCHPHLRTFIYSKGPRFFTRVVKRPFYKGAPLIEVDKHGHRVYN